VPSDTIKRREYDLTWIIRRITDNGVGKIGR
jgi:hypothetical protein